MNRIIALFLTLSIALVSCEQKPKDNSSENLEIAEKQEILIEDAVNFSMWKQGNNTYIEVPQSYKGAPTSTKYLLVPKTDTVPDHDEDIIIIRTPVEKMVCTATVHLPAIEMLNEIDALVGFPSTKFISSEKINERVKSGNIQELGMDSKLNMETLTSLEPEAVFGYTLNGNSQDLEQVNRLGIPVILQAAYLEKTPLGRAEWVKFIGAFFNKQELAEQKYKEIKSAYLAVKEKVKTTENKPTAFTGVVYNDVWYVPGGESWPAKLLDEAGVNYLWANDSSSGSMSMAFEAVYDKAAEADQWIGAAQYKSLQELLQSNERYAQFKAFKEGEVYAYIKRINENGGNDYFEAGTARPDLILSDLVKIAHPELLPDYEMYFYEKLK